MGTSCQIVTLLKPKAAGYKYWIYIIKTFPFMCCALVVVIDGQCKVSISWIYQKWTRHSENHQQYFAPSSPPSAKILIHTWLESADINTFSHAHTTWSSMMPPYLLLYVNLNRIERWPTNYVIAISISNISASRKRKGKRRHNTSKQTKDVRKRVWIHFPKHLEILPTCKFPSIKGTELQI